MTRAHCLSCDWTTEGDPDDVDKAANRHTNTEGHGTGTQMVGTVWISPNACGPDGLSTKSRPASEMAPPREKPGFHTSSTPASGGSCGGPEFSGLRGPTVKNEGHPRGNGDGPLTPVRSEPTTGG